MNISAQTGPVAVDATLSQLLDGGPLADALPRVAARIRQQPKDAAQRMLYFDLLCLTGAWEKALPVLQMAVDMDAGLTPVAYVCRQLVQAELFRVAVFAGQHEPAYSLTAADGEAASPAATPAWLTALWQALHAQHSGDLARADALRREALNQCPDSAGQLWCAASEQKAEPAPLPFTWLADSDSRLGPVLEVFAGGRYAWLPFRQIHSLTLRGPRSLQDLLWLPATLTLVATSDMPTTGDVDPTAPAAPAAPGEEIPCFVPGRYAGSEGQEDALALGRETRWQNVGETGVVALGQKTLTCDAGDVPLYDVRRILINSSPVPAL